MDIKQQLIKELEQATFQGTWEEVNAAQRRLDAWVSLEKKLTEPETLAVFQRMKDR